tara:strand:- start:215 stop:808 length:594 start_codon:yes stop_codon:yes gene_type:complete
MLLQSTDGSGLIVYLILGLLAAAASWVNKRKEAAKLEQKARAVPVQRSKQEPAAESGEGKPSGWMGRLEQLVEAQLEKVDDSSQRLEREYADDYEQESAELPPMIGAATSATPPPVGVTREGYRETPLARQLREDEQASATRKSAPVRSPVYDSPIYASNIAQQITSDIKVARQAVVASIILSTPKSLENPEQVTRH